MALAACALVLSDDPIAVPTMWKRIITAALLLPAVVWLALAAPPLWFQVAIVLLSAAGVWEVGRMFERVGRPSAGWFAVVAGALVTASFAVANGPMLALTMVVLATLTTPLVSRDALSTDRVTTTLLALTWVSWLMGHALLLHALPGGAALVLYLAAITWAGESAAYFVGSTIGRTKLAPAVSPNKTVEGAVAQVVASLIAAFVLQPWLAPAWSAGWVTAAALLLGTVGQVGDLAESVVKRSLGAKDTGGLIPGHGGVLDRLDGLLFNVPAFYYLVTYLVPLGGATR